MIGIFAEKVICNSLVVLTDGCVVVEDEKIVDVGKKSELVKNYKFDDVLEGKIAMPGLIDAHMHSFQAPTKGKTCDKTLINWLKEYIWPWEASIDKEKARACAELSYIEMIKSGTTSFSDFTSIKHTDEAFKFAEKLGVRANIGKTMMDENSPDNLIEKTIDSLKETERLIKKWHGRGILKYVITPRFDISCSDDLFYSAASLAKKYNVRIQTHAEENQEEVATEQMYTSRNAIKTLETLQLMDENLILVHCIWLSEASKRKIIKNNVKVVHCPGSNMMLASGVSPMPLEMDTALGSDVGAYYNFSMFEQMRLASLLQRVSNKNVSVIDHKKCFEMATVNGAKCLGLEEVGTIEKGKKADIVLLSNDYSLVPLNDPVAQVVYSCNREAVDSVLINGKVIMKNKEILTVDEKKIMAHVREIL